MKEFDFAKMPIVEIANEILLDGVKKGASDIHFDPCKDGLSIRMRVDGVLYDYAKVPADFKRNMISRIKMIASMNIMETRLPQDGAIKSKIGDKMLDLRVSSLPTHSGEKVVLRILDYSKSLQGLESLGFSEHNLDKIIKMIEMPNGIVLVTGATGSGKSTTVYSILQKLNTREVNIITVEDPVEMEVEGLNQVQAQQEIGLDFANVLRSILRQDPDIIMIGEIRDGETASIAVRASITGHKVLSTIHTNSALNTIERLTDMGVERYLIGTSLNGVISQKLARKICPHCRVQRDVTDYEKQLFRKVTHKDIDKIYDINPDGCEHCFRGYKGRICIAEVLVITDEVRTAITNAESKDIMRKLVYIDAHTHTLLEDGLEKVINGETNFDEILKLVDLENDLAIHNAFYDEVEADLAKEKKEGKTKEKKETKEDKDVAVAAVVTEEEKPEEVKTEEAPVEEVKTEETPPVEEIAPVEEVKTEEAPEETEKVEEVKVEETPAEEVKIEEAPVEEVKIEDAPQEETPAEVIPEAPALPEAPVLENPIAEVPQADPVVETLDIAAPSEPAVADPQLETFDVVTPSEPVIAEPQLETFDMNPQVVQPQLETFDVAPQVVLEPQLVAVPTQYTDPSILQPSNLTMPQFEMPQAVPQTGDINYEALVPVETVNFNPNVTTQVIPQ